MSNKRHMSSIIHCRDWQILSIDDSAKMQQKGCNGKVAIIILKGGWQENERLHQLSTRLFASFQSIGRKADVLRDHADFSVSYVSSCDLAIMRKMMARWWKMKLEWHSWWIIYIHNSLVSLRTYDISYAVISRRFPWLSTTEASSCSY